MMRSISTTKGLIRIPDPEMAAKALAEHRIVLTFDLDFGDILDASHVDRGACGRDILHL
jgi:predicted nuclease of predicted toxin-antitoxin system